MYSSLTIAMASAVVALLFAVFAAVKVLRMKPGTPKMIEIAKAIESGAKAFLKREYMTISIFVVVLAAVFYQVFGYITSLSFVLGAVLSALAGAIGMLISVKANVRTANAASRGLSHALSASFLGGSVTGFAVVGLGLLGVSVLYFFYPNPMQIIGFTFGASLISLFARVGGGIFTKGADVGADLVGKIEKGIPEDDPRNPAVIADNVGDNVGDCAGMAADLFESYVVTIIAALLLGLASGNLIQPFLMSAIAIFASIVGTFFVKTNKADSNAIWHALYKSILVTSLVAGIGFFGLFYYLNQMNFFYVSLMGLLTTVAIGFSTEHYTGRDKKPVREIAEMSKTGAGTNIIAGIAIGMKSTLVPVIMISLAILVSYYFAGVYGIALAAVAMLSTTGIVVAVDSFGPIADNAGGIAEMSKMSARVRKITDPLDAVGNTTKAVTKGYAIGSAALAALSLFVAFAEATGLTSINIISPTVVVGLFIGGMLPFLFSSLTMRAVGRSAYTIVEEVRRQFKEIHGLMSGKAKPDYAKCVDISTKGAIRELALPALIAVISPLIVGFVLGPEALGGLLAGSIVTGLLLAITMTTAGGAWDNAKKFIELGNFGGKGSDVHKAAIVGDTVGDPFKDTAGPSLNPLIKVLNTISILFATLIATHALL
ncbi:MAG TPA: sodium-translocating pyrophosphatase [archaeon]|nr:sodium-translocating pyrophosphatase [archaeon]